MQYRPHLWDWGSRSGRWLRSGTDRSQWRHLLKSVGWLLVLLPCLPLSCGVLAAGLDLGTLLHQSAGLAPEATTNAILDGTFKLKRASIENDTPLRIHFSVPGASDLEGVSHYLAGSVSEYTTCLLQVREQKTTREVLEEVSPDLLAGLETDFCGPCCGGLVEVQRSVLEALQRYWVGKLRLE